MNSPPMFVYFSGDWDVWGYVLLTHGQISPWKVAMNWVSIETAAFGGSKKGGGGNPAGLLAKTACCPQQKMGTL